jgi:hypothetical protein
VVRCIIGDVVRCSTGDVLRCIIGDVDRGIPVSDVCEGGRD